MNRRLFGFISLILIIILILSACDRIPGLPPISGQSETPRGKPGDKLDGTRWTLVSYADEQGNAVNVLPEAQVNANFAVGKVSGNGSCNNYNGNYQIDGDQIKISDIATTMMACSEPVMAQESAYLKNLQSASAYEIRDNQLQIVNSAGEVVLTYTASQQASLTGTLWQLVQYNDGKGGLVSVLPGTEITAIFGVESDLTGFAGCNDYKATYLVDGSTLRITPPGVTRKSCPSPEGVMQQENDYLSALMSVAAHEIKGDNLEMTSTEGTWALVYTKKYGAALVTPAQAEESSAALTAEALKNAEYKVQYTGSGLAKLQNGEYREPAAPDSASQVVIQMSDLMTTGELNGQQTAAVVLLSQSGGSGTFYDLALVVDQEGQPVNIATILLGDRVKVNSVSIENNEVVVDMVNQGPNDAACCPTQHVVQRYTLQGIDLVQSSSEVLGTVTPTPEVRVDAQGLAQSVEAKVIPATPYDNTQPSGPTGAPEHVAVFFDGQEVLNAYPIQEYLDLWEGAGDNTITDNMDQLYELLETSPETVQAPLPILPPQSGTNDLALQYTTVDFINGTGIRFVGRTTQGQTPITNDQLKYYYQGATSDGKYYVSFIYPIAAAGLPYSASELTDETRQKVEQEYEAYFQETSTMLQSMAPTDFSPSLEQLDSVVKTMFVHAAGGAGPNPEMLGVTWKWQSFNGIAVPKPDLFTLILQPDGTFQFTADCNSGGGTYVADDVQITFTFGEMTQNDCGRESLSTVFVKMLPSALTYVLNEANLTFKLTGSGSMVFVK